MENNLPTTTYKKILLLDISGCTQSICQGTGVWDIPPHTLCPP